MRSGQTEQASQISIKIGRLIAENRTQLLTKARSQDTRKLWQAVNETRNQGTRQLDELGPPFDDSDAINRYFAAIATDPAYDRQQIDDFIKPSENDRDHVNDNFCFQEYEVTRALKEVKRTSSGADPLPYWLFKYCAYELAPLLPICTI